MSKVKISGVVEGVISRSTSAGITHAIVIDGIQYGTYKTEPNVQEGDNVEFLASQNGRYWNADTRSITKVAGSSAPAKQAAPKTRQWVPDADRQNAISYQAARKDALEFVGMLVSSGNIDLGKSAKVGSKIEALEQYVDRYTMRFFEDTKNLGHNNKPEDEAKSDDFEDDDIPF